MALVRRIFVAFRGYKHPNLDIQSCTISRKRQCHAANSRRLYSGPAEAERSSPSGAGRVVSNAFCCRCSRAGGGGGDSLRSAPTRWRWALRLPAAQLLAASVWVDLAGHHLSEPSRSRAADSAGASCSVTGMCGPKRLGSRALASWARQCWPRAGRGQWCLLSRRYALKGLSRRTRVAVLHLDPDRAIGDLAAALLANSG